MDDKKGAANREQVQVGQKKRIVHAMPRNPEGGVSRCTNGAATVDQPDELVEVRLCYSTPTCKLLLQNWPFLLNRWFIQVCHSQNSL